uniref:Uncharacterized protein n=1 Tax=Lepeophtheirus salmonis TaxID=72036 RepID=A0A0K2V1H9_LEPSM
MFFSYDYKIIFQFIFLMKKKETDNLWHENTVSLISL